MAILESFGALYRMFQQAFKASDRNEEELGKKELHRKKLELLKTLTDAELASDISKATETSREYTRLFPESAYPHLLVAQMHHKAGRDLEAFECYKQAEQLLDDVMEKDPNNMIFYLQTVVNLVTTAVMHYRKTNDPSLVEKMVKDGYRNGELYFSLGRVSFEKQEYARAKEWMDKSLLDKKMLENLVTEAHIYRGLCNIATDNICEGEKDLQTAERRAPNKKGIIAKFKAEMCESKGLYTQSLEALFEQDWGTDSFNPDDLLPN